MANQSAKTSYRVVAAGRSEADLRSGKGADEVIGGVSDERLGRRAHDDHLSGRASGVRGCSKRLCSSGVVLDSRVI